MNNFGVEEKLLFSLARDHAGASLTPNSYQFEVHV